MDFRISISAVLIVLLVVLGIMKVPSAPETSESSTNSAEATRVIQENSDRVEIVSGGQTYPAYIAEPESTGQHPAIVLLHSINGLSPGYLEMSDALASSGYVVLALEWQTYERIPHDDVVIELVHEAIDLLSARSDVDANRIGLTGFCIGGRYTMLQLPLIDEFAAGVAWYGFPYRGLDANENWPQAPNEVIQELDAPMLIIHGTDDNPSPIADIYQYATELDEANKYFEMKIYQGEPHSFMLDDGNLSQSFAAQDALQEMISFFDRTLK